ncbi:hypothetical protein AB3466_11170 [Sphingobacterium thalpophilum]|uniref:hypothetical protein n=1 Tax=Sphingobacterium thalpophilum TaxID=259 RepID=UPI0037DA02D8
MVKIPQITKIRGVSIAGKGSTSPEYAGGGCYLLLGIVEVDFHFPTITITKMAKMPFIADPRYSHDEEKRYEAQQRIKEDVSMTFRLPYPQENEIGLPRFRKDTL